VDALVAASGEEATFLLELASQDPRLCAGTLAPIFLLEALAQAAAAFYGLQREGTPESGMLVEIDRSTFLGPAARGERVELFVRRTRSLGNLVRFTGRATVSGRVLVAGELTVARANGQAT
jgi:3-hydroxymyristoyl/3-hydroxydecanoyl-(acyl carrier protein) dehydratase